MYSGELYELLYFCVLLLMLSCVVTLSKMQFYSRPPFHCVTFLPVVTLCGLCLLAFNQ